MELNNYNTSDCYAKALKQVKSKKNKSNGEHDKGK